MHDKVLYLIYVLIDEYSEKLADEPKLEKSVETVLFRKIQEI